MQWIILERRDSKHASFYKNKMKKKNYCWCPKLLIKNLATCQFNFSHTDNIKTTRVVTNFFFSLVVYCGFEFGELPIFPCCRSLASQQTETGQVIDHGYTCLLRFSKIYYQVLFWWCCNIDTTLFVGKKRSSRIYAAGKQ